MRVVPCLAGYQGSACSECSAGHYRLVQSCVPCPKGAYLLLGGYVLAIGASVHVSLAGMAAVRRFGCPAHPGHLIMAVAGKGGIKPCMFRGVCCATALFILIAGIAHKKKVNMSALGIGVDFLQVP